MSTEFQITTDNSYHEAMMTIYELMNKGEANLTIVEIEQLSKMTLAVEKYENEILMLEPTNH